MRPINLLKSFPVLCAVILNARFAKSAVLKCTETTITNNKTECEALGYTDTTECSKVTFTGNKPSGLNYCYDTKTSKIVDYTESNVSGKLGNEDKISINDFSDTGRYFYDPVEFKPIEAVKGSGIVPNVFDVVVSDDQLKVSSWTEGSYSKGYYYVQGNHDFVVYCSDKCYLATVAQPGYLKTEKNLIKCEDKSNSSCEEYPESGKVSDGYYINAAFDETDDSSSKQLLKCSGGTCEEISGSEDANYVDAGNEGSLIQCKKKTVTISGKSADIVACESNSNVTGKFINNSEFDKSTNPLISCSGDCKTVAVEGSYKYYENGDDNSDKSKIILCSSSKGCSLDETNIGNYYVGDNDEDNKGLISCVSDNATPTPAPICTYKAPSTSSGYYLNSGGDSSTKQTIICGDGCVATHVNPGYFKNADTAAVEGTDDIIQCNLNSCTKIGSTSIACPSTPTNAGACYNSSGEFQFYKSENITEPITSSNNDMYLYDKIKSFPSISGDVTTLYRLSKIAVERYIASGVVGVNPTSNEIASDSSGTLGTDIMLYDCSSSTKTCTKRVSCTNNSYMYDINNQKALYCNGEKLESISAAGYYVDGVTLVGTKTPYIIECDKDTGTCNHVLPTVASYFINAGYDKTSNALIYCNGSNCYTVTASNGNYVGVQQEGIITCTSSTSCTYKNANAAGNNVNYVNNGADKSTSALIYCTKKSCVPKSAKSGYYFSNRVSVLIYCESSNSCSEISPTQNYYYYADTTDSKNYIINCSKISTSIICSKEIADTGSYLTNQSNVLITCSKGGSCKQIIAKPGYYQSAVKITINSKRDVSSVDSESELVSEISGRDSTTTYNIIECSTTTCELLTAEELSTIPVCEYSSDKCYITLAYALSKSAVTSITAGNICTNSDRSKFYFATDTIVVAPSVIAGQTATYVYTTTTTNCLLADDKYNDYYYTVGSDIYHISDGTISHFYDTGYYFINIEKNTLVNSNNIDNYNNENVKLYKCNGVSCRIMDEPEDATYYADVNKRIVKYNVNSDSYSFAYEKDITCIFANNKCTPNADLNNREFCITYKGELVLAASDIKNRETGECYRASSVNGVIYGYNQYLYKMDVNSATVIDDNGYYLISLSSNNTVSSKDYKNRMITTNSIRVYGCYNSNCKIYEPEEGVYYYDANAKTMLKNEDGGWVAPQTSGYAVVSINPNEKYIYKFKTELDEVSLLSTAANGYYYTIDNEMYECNENDLTCSKIDESDYYFTNTGEIYYCVYDSENLEKTECTKQSCYVGQNYYISDNYYRCEAGSYLTPIKSRNCKYDENVIVNFPTILKEEFPSNIKQAIENIEKNNNSTAIATRSNKKYLSVVPAIFTNCTYNVEETEASYDFVCINNYVSVNEEDDTLEICSIENLGYADCIDDESNPKKCNPSAGYARIVFNFFSLVITAFATLYVIIF